MRIFAGSDGRVYFQHDDQITSTTIDDAVGALAQLAEAINAARPAAREAAERKRTPPVEVTRELLR